MSIFGLPLYMFTVPEVDDEMGDIEYLSIKEFENKRVDVNATLSLNNTSTETDLVTQTANTGKDMYLGAASFNGRITNQAGGELGSVTYVLYINGFEKEKGRKIRGSKLPGLFCSWNNRDFRKYCFNGY